MPYPDAYCVRCKAHTDTLGKHTIVLSNKRRALKGVCPVCATETYRLMPEKEDKIVPPISLIKSMAVEKEHKNSDAPLYQSKLDHLARQEISRHNSAQKLVNIGLLMTIFGLSIACSFMLCVVLFR